MQFLVFDKSVKYVLWISFGMFLTLLAYYSIYYRRADEAVYIVFLTSFFSLSIIAISRHFEKINFSLNYLIAAIGIVIPAAGLFVMISDAPYRPYGLIGDRTFEAEITTGLFLFLVANFILKNENKIRPAITFAAVITSGTYLVSLRSRTAYIVTSVCLLLMGLFAFIRNIKTGNVYFGRKRYKILMLVSAIVFSAVISAVIPFKHPQDRDTFKKTITGVYDMNISTNKARLDFWRASLEMFISNPLTGVGTGMWPGVYPKFSGSTYTDANIDLNSAVRPHNDYLEFLSEYGIAGIFYIIFISAGIVLLSRKSFNDSRFFPYLITAICFSLISLFNFPKDDAVTMIFFLVCLSAGYAKYEGTGNKKLLRLNIGFFLLLFLSTVSLFIFRQRCIENYRTSLFYKARKEYPEALNYMNKISETLYPADMNRTPVEYYKGALYYELNEYDKALSCFNKAAAIMPYYPTIMSNRAAALYKTGDVQKSVEIYSEIKTVFPNFFEPQINLLAIYANQKSDKKAKELLDDLDKRINGSQFIKNYIVFLEIKNYYLKNRL